MRNRNGKHIAGSRFRKPGRFVGGNPGAHQARLVPSDSVISQCGAIFVSVNNLAERNKTQLNQRLETVANAAHQSVAVFKQIIYFCLNFFISEKRRNKLARTVRLIAARKTARNKDNLRFLDFLCKIVRRICNSFCGKVVNDNNFRRSARRF